MSVLAPTHERPVISRRRLTVGAAWALPIVAASAATPAFAASANMCITTSVLTQCSNGPLFAPADITFTVTAVGDELLAGSKLTIDNAGSAGVPYSQTVTASGAGSPQVSGLTVTLGSTIPAGRSLTITVKVMSELITQVNVNYLTPTQKNCGRLASQPVVGHFPAGTYCG